MSRYQRSGQQIARKKKLAASGGSEVFRNCRAIVRRLQNCNTFELWRGDHRIGSQFDDDAVPLDLRLRVARSK